MKQISAADNITIEIDENHWRMVNGADSEPAALAQASGPFLRYNMSFGADRRLPASGQVASQDILQVVVGWSQEDAAWHLGMLLAPALAQERGSRWCEIAHWPDLDAELFEELAQEAGRSLATVLGISFNAVPPHPQDFAPAPPLPEPPFTFGDWTLTRETIGADPEAENAPYHLTRSPNWLRRRQRKLIGYGIWSVVYFVLSIATLTSDLALPNTGTLLPDPRILPYLGLATGAGLIVLILYHLYAMRSVPDQFVISPASGSIDARRAGQTLWTSLADDVQSLYVTEVIRKGKGTAVEYGELNLHLGGGRFRFVAQHTDPEINDKARNPDFQKPAEDVIMPLERDQSSTDLQLVALHIAEALGELPCWYDLRLK